MVNQEIEKNLEKFSEDFGSQLHNLRCGFVSFKLFS